MQHHKQTVVMSHSSAVRITIIVQAMDEYKLDICIFSLELFDKVQQLVCALEMWQSSDRLRVRLLIDEVHHATLAAGAIPNALVW